ncbi:MAG: hypothetical protein U0R17_02605 [Acidimicrobiia bacterium]
MIKRIALVLLLVISTFGSVQLINISDANAADASRFNPGRIIDDRIFTNTSSMNTQQIQNFLNTVNGVGSTCLKNYITDQPLGNNTYGGPVSAAQAISDVSTLYGLNPQVILVTLQKEQSLITTTNCSDSKYRSAMGFGCPDTAPCDAQWYGLSKQLYQGARHLKGFYNNSLSFVPFKVGNYYIGWHPNGACGGTVVNIQSRGTAALYSYTPYQPNAAALSNLYGTGDSCSSYGNRNFWRDFTDWFGSPTGDLVRSLSDNTVYLLSNNVKYPISSGAILSDYGILGPLSIVDQSYLNNISSGSILTRMVGSTDVNDSTLYLIVAGIKLPFTSCQLVSDYGFSCASVNRLTPIQLNMFVNGPLVTSLIKSNSQSTVFYIKDGKKRPIGSWQDLVQLNVGYSINSVTDELLDSIPTGDLVVTGGSLIKVSTSASVYAVNDWNGNPTIFPVTSFGYTNDLGLGTDVRTVSSNQLSSFNVSSNLKATVKCGLNTYVGTNGILYKIDPSIYSHFGYTNNTFLSSGDICSRFTISQTQMSRFILNRGTIYFVENGTKRGFTSYSAFLANGGGSSPTISVSNLFADGIQNGPTISN